MAQLLKDYQVVEEHWTIVDEQAESLPCGNILLSVSQRQQFASQLKQQDGKVGIWLDGNAKIEEIVESLLDLPLIAIKFPTFSDGRGFSLARLLRERYQYTGELRAIGGIIRDQLYLLRRCGFNAFQFAEGVDLSEAAKSLDDFSEAYQVATDQTIPLFRRR